MAANRQTYNTHNFRKCSHIVTLVWGSLRLAPIKLEFSFGEEIRYVEYALVPVNTPLSQAEGKITG